MRVTKAETGQSTLEGDIKRYLFGRILLAVGGFLSIPLINRGVGVENYGLISLWTTLSSWVPLIVAGWLQQSTLRYYKLYHDEQRAEGYRRTLQLATCILAGMTVLATAVAMCFMGRLLWQEIALTALLAGATVFNMCYAAIAQADLKAARVVLADLARTLLPVLLFGIHFAAAGSVSRTVTLLYFLIGMGIASGALHYSTRPESPAAGRVRTDILRRMFAFGLPMGIWFGLSTGQMLVGRLVLQRLHMAAALGHFTIYQDFFAKTGTVLFMPVTYAVHGRVMALWAERNWGQARDAIRRAYLYQAGLGVVLAAGAIAVHGALSRVLMGSVAASVDTRESALLLMLGVIASNLALISHKGMELGERTRQMAGLMGVSVAINIGLSVWFAHLWGGVGVAAGLLSANVFYLIVTHLYSRQVLDAAVRNGSSLYELQTPGQDLAA